MTAATVGASSSSSAFISSQPTSLSRTVRFPENSEFNFNSEFQSPMDRLNFVDFRVFIVRMRSQKLAILKIKKFISCNLNMKNSKIHGIQPKCILVKFRGFMNFAYSKIQDCHPKLGSLTTQIQKSMKLNLKIRNPKIHEIQPYYKNSKIHGVQPIYRLFKGRRSHTVWQPERPK